MTAVVTLVNMLLAAVTILAAYGGMADPEKVPIAALAAMFLAPVMLADLVVLAIDLFFWRKAALPIIAACIISVKPLLVFAPLNLNSASLTPEQEKRTFTILTYNCLHFWDNETMKPGDGSRNKTIDFILKTDADIVNLQELEEKDLDREAWQGKFANIPPEQLSEIRKKYPFRFYNPRPDALAFWSKYPAMVEPYPLKVDSMPNVRIYEVHVHGKIVHFFNVHMRSILLTPEDKELYKRIFKPAVESERALKEEVKEVKLRLIDKLTTAFAARAREARYLRECLDSIKGNTIVAGDFNDIPGCYAVREIMDGDMHDAYAESGFGPVITFHANHFYFRIDQILYRGALEAVRMKRIKVPYSDHYPMLARFYIEK